MFFLFVFFKFQILILYYLIIKLRLVNGHHDYVGRVMLVRNITIQGIGGEVQNYLNTGKRHSDELLVGWA